MGEAVACKNCGGKQLKFKENSDTDEHWVHCDTCGQIGPVKGSVPEAGDAWNEANTPTEAKFRRSDAGPTLGSRLFPGIFPA